MAKPTVYDLLRQKGKRKFLEMHVDCELEAAAAEAAGIHILTCEIDAKFPLIRQAAPNTFIQASGPRSAVSSADEGVRRAFDALDLGADAFYFSGSLLILEAIAREGIPVTGHIGLVPDLATWTNFRAIGKTSAEAVALFRKLKALESAGAWAVEVEVVPTRVAELLTRSTTMLTEGMGSGTGCDTQYLYSSDVLGTNPGHYPRHSKRYADILAALAEVQQRRIHAFKAFADDVASGAYPETRHQVEIDDAEFAAFREQVGGL